MVYRTPEKSKITINEAEVIDSDYDFSLAAIKNRIEKMNCAQEHGALHHQCIDELSSHFTSGTQIENGADNNKSNIVSSTSPAPSVTPSSFVTVIEVKESTPISIEPLADDNAPEDSPSKPAVSNDTNRSTKSDDSFSSTIHLDVKRRVPPR